MTDLWDWMIRHVDAPKTLVAAALLAVFWLWETGFPFKPVGARIRHAGRNLAFGLVNTLILAVVFGSLTVAVADATTEREWGLLHALGFTDAVTFCLGLVFLDAWSYLWHRANHVVPILWRFHRMHHADDRMDATTAVRFHLGELLLSAVLRLGLIPLVGLSAWEVIVYDAALLGITLFHHANISLGKFDRVLRTLLVTPAIHKVHHSHLRDETNSNYGVFFSFWDRLGRSLRLRSDLDRIKFGLDEFESPYWQSIPGMLIVPFAKTAPAHSQVSASSAKMNVQPANRSSPEETWTKPFSTT